MLGAIPNWQVVQAMRNIGADFQICIFTRRFYARADITSAGEMRFWTSLQYKENHGDIQHAARIQQRNASVLRAANA